MRIIFVQEISFFFTIYWLFGIFTQKVFFY